MMKLRYSTYDVFLYLILIPFLYPRGFAEYIPMFKSFFDAWLLASMALIVLLFIYQVIRQKITPRPSLFFIFLYYILFICITFALQGSVSEGIQKLFVAPVLCLFSIICLELHKKSFLRCVSNILIINFALNLTVFHPAFFPMYFSEETLHLLFLGHVQVVAPLGILGIYIGYLLYRLDKKEHVKAIVLILLSIGNMLFSQTSASIIALVILSLGFLLAYVLKLRQILCLNPHIYLLIYLVLNILALYYVRYFTDTDLVVVTDATTLNGRVFIWDEALILIEKKPITGYGAYGVLLQMFWHASDEGMNYAHNELLQRLLDGGILLLVAFLLLLSSYVKPIQRIKHDKGSKGMANLCLIAMLFVMTFESLTEYYYIFIFLSLLVYAPEFSELFQVQVKEREFKKRKRQKRNRIESEAKN